MKTKKATSNSIDCGGLQPFLECADCGLNSNTEPTVSVRQGQGILCDDCSDKRHIETSGYVQEFDNLHGFMAPNLPAGKQKGVFEFPIRTAFQVQQVASLIGVTEERLIMSLLQNSIDNIRNRLLQGLEE